MCLSSNGGARRCMAWAVTVRPPSFLLRWQWLRRSTPCLWKRFSRRQAMRRASSTTRHTALEHSEKCITACLSGHRTSTFSATRDGAEDRRHMEKTRTSRPSWARASCEACKGLRMLATRSYSLAPSIMPFTADPSGAVTVLMRRTSSSEISTRRTSMPSVPW